MSLQRAVAVLLAAGALATVPRPASVDEISLAVLRQGLADPDWARPVAGPVERLLSDNRFTRGAAGLAIRYRIPPHEHLTVELEASSFGDTTELKGWRAEWSALGLGLMTGPRLRFAEDRLLATLEVGGRLLFTNVGVLSDIGEEGNFFAAAFPLARGRARLAWQVPVEGQVDIRIGAEAGWSEIKPVRYGPLGTLHVGGLQTGLSLGIVFDGVIAERTAGPAAPPDAAPSPNTDPAAQEPPSEEIPPISPDPATDAAPPVPLDALDETTAPTPSEP